MAERTITRRPEPVPPALQWMNLFIPGTGLVTLGPVWAGVALALLFSAGASFALVGALVAPLDISPSWRSVAIGGAATSYLVSQLALSRRWRRARMSQAGLARREGLRAVQSAISNDSPEAALDALEPLIAREPDDLLLRFRLAQVAQLAAAVRPAEETRGAALQAWRALKLLDRHRIYQAQIQRHLADPLP